MKNHAYVFDAYGTLLDIQAASHKHSKLLGENTAKVSDLWRKKQLEYTWLRSLMGVHVDFWEITRDALSYTWNISRLMNWSALMNSAQVI
mgnify:CR=1 FL=1